jgi:mRNA-degrading endonuclease toxin of MazEF toxin-antitoxin module
MVRAQYPMEEVWGRRLKGGLRATISLTFGGKKGLVLLDHVRTLDKARLVRKLGAVSSTTLSAVLRTLQEIFA